MTLVHRSNSGKGIFVSPEICVNRGQGSGVMGNRNKNLSAEIRWSIVIFALFALLLANKLLPAPSSDLTVDSPVGTSYPDFLLIDSANLREDFARIDSYARFNVRMKDGSLPNRDNDIEELVKSHALYKRQASEAHDSGNALEEARAKQHLDAVADSLDRYDPKDVSVAMSKWGRP